MVNGIVTPHEWLISMGFHVIKYTIFPWIRHGSKSMNCSKKQIEPPKKKNLLWVLSIESWLFNGDPFNNGLWNNLHLTVVGIP